MESPVVKKKKTTGQRLVWWGWFTIFVPIILLIISFLCDTGVSLVFNILGESGPGEPLTQIQDLLTALLRFIGLLGVGWALALGPFGILFIIIGYIKRWREKKLTPLS